MRYGNSIEIWKGIPGYEGLYLASNYGRIRSLGRVALSTLGKPYHKPERVLTPSKCNGYYTVSLTKDGSKVCRKVHRLVMAAFCGASDYAVDHKDNDKANNHLSNLRYCTKEQNCSLPNRKRISSSGAIGVSICKSKKNPYRASIRRNNKSYHLGCFNSIEEAESVYKEAALKHQGALPQFNQVAP